MDKQLLELKLLLNQTLYDQELIDQKVFSEMEKRILSLLKKHGYQEN